MNGEPFLTYRFEGFKFEFGPRDEIRIINERHSPFFETYRVQINEYHPTPFIIILEEKGMKNESQ